MKVQQSDGSVKDEVQLTGSSTIQVSTPAAAVLGLAQQVTAYGTARVTVEPSSKFSDPFDGGTLDTTDRWTAGGTSVPTQANGQVILSLGTGNAISSTLISKPTFPANIGMNIFGATVTLDTSLVPNPNVHRFWGFGQVTSYAALTPVTDGAGFECDLTGDVNAVVYIGGVRYVINSSNPTLITAQGSLPAGSSSSTFGAVMSFPSKSHRYVVTMRGDLVFFYIDSLDTPVGMASFMQPNVQTLPVRIAAITTAAVSTVLASTFILGAIAVGDSAAQNNTVSDPVFPWRGATVKAPSTATAATDSPLVVAHHPSTNVNVVGTAADSATAAGSPVQVGGKVRTSVDTTYTNGDAQTLTTTTDMQMLVKPYGLPETDWQYASAGAIINTTDVVAKTAGAASVRNYVTGLQVKNTNAVATEFVIKDGATVIWRGYLPASMINADIIDFPTPLRGTAATAVNVACITTGASVYANVQGYQGL
ncbi:hypothetical protein [Paenibacillus sp. P32E]|uniref:hypothetical protein n=1 Tax=Paenibacillus sp. P32E TaxID=1349434 RepID=UPI00093A1416|nr:hypothetical protein [Paenibacillus sp. P32E]OKP91414.1 hypothetical protein A3848_09945 [Paenibacillus sp. P32E]